MMYVSYYSLFGTLNLSTWHNLPFLFQFNNFLTVKTISQNTTQNWGFIVLYIDKSIVHMYNNYTFSNSFFSQSVQIAQQCRMCFSFQQWVGWKNIGEINVNVVT